MTITTGRRRLTDEQRRDRATSGLDLQRLIVGRKPPGLAVIYGWLHVHFRPAKTERGWRTPGSGELLAGWPDLTLVHVRKRRLIFAELKRELLDDPSPDQVFVLDVLRSLETVGERPLLEAVNGALRATVVPRIEVHVWRPSDLTEGRIEAVLR
jgi:hypothetical protein